MNAHELLATIAKSSYTKKDIVRRIRLTREYLEEEYFKGERHDLTKFLLGKRATTDDIDAFLAIGEEYFTSFSKENAYDLLGEMQEAAKELTLINLYIPYEPVPAEITKLGKWFRSNVGEKVILDIRTDGTLLGGCAFAKKGVYRDYSLRYFMRKHREEISSIINMYVERFYQA